MKKLSIIIFMLLCACTTPKTVLKHPKTGQVAICGGNAESALAGGVIGYHIQKANDDECVNDYLNEGFKTINKEE